MSRYFDDGLFDSESVTREPAEELVPSSGTSSLMTRLKQGHPAATDVGRIVYTRAITLWAMLSQALFTGLQRSCRAAV